MKYYVSITETLNKVVSVEAADRQEAAEKVSRAYYAQSVILNSDDYIGAAVEVEPDQSYYQNEEADGQVWQHVTE